MKNLPAIMKDHRIPLDQRIIAVLQHGTEEERHSLLSVFADILGFDKAKTVESAYPHQEERLE